MPSTGVGGILVQSAPPGYTDPHQPGNYPALTLQASTPLAGVALVNGTPTFLTWNVPNDGNLHYFMVMGALHVTSTETGGAVNYNYTLPDGFAAGHSVFASGNAAGDVTPNNTALQIVGPGTQVTINQTALTGGAALVWLSIWGS